MPAASQKLMAQLGDLIDLDAKTITGATLRDVVAGAEEVPGQDAIRARKNPIKPEGAMAVLHGNLAPRGAVIKHSAAKPQTAAAYRPRRWYSNPWRI